MSLGRILSRPYRPPTPFFTAGDLYSSDDSDDTEEYEDDYDVEEEEDTEEDEQGEEYGHPLFSGRSKTHVQPTTPCSEELPATPFFYSPYLPPSDELPEDIYVQPSAQKTQEGPSRRSVPIDDNVLPLYQTPPMVYRMPEEITRSSSSPPVFDDLRPVNQTPSHPPRCASLPFMQSTMSKPNPLRFHHAHSTSDPYSDDWVCPVKLTLSELFKGLKCHFELHRHATKPRKRIAAVDFVVHPGTTDDTTFLCRGMGNERPNGTFQDVVFVVKETPHEEFARVGNDLFLDLTIPALSLGLHEHPRRHHTQHLHHSHGPRGHEKERELKIRGVCGEEYIVDVHQLLEKSSEDKVRHGRRGVHVIVGAGMPTRSKHGRINGRGNMIVRSVLYQFFSVR
jgi:hypothetical protein